MTVATWIRIGGTFLGWQELGKLALAVGGVTLSREAYESACALGGVRPGRGFTRDDPDRFYRLLQVQGKLQTAYERVAARGGPAETRGGSRLVIPEAAGLSKRRYSSKAKSSNVCDFLVTRSTVLLRRRSRQNEARTRPRRCGRGLR